MKAVVVTKERTDYARDVETYLGDFRRVTGRELEVIDPESPDGVSFCRTYDILQFPTLVALDDSGQMLNIWKGLPFPTINEVSYYN